MTQHPRPVPAPRLPVPVRALLPAVLLLPIASSTLLPALLPPARSALETQDAHAAFAYALVTGVPLVLYLLISIVLVRAVDRRPVSALGLRPGWRAVLGLAAGVLISSAVMIAATIVLEASGLGRTLPQEVVDGAAPAAMPLGVVLAMLVLRAFVLQGIGEEVLFRGYLLQTLSRRPAVAVIGSAVLFAIPHLASSGGQEGVLQRVLYLVMPLGFALSAGVLAIALRSVWAAVGIHGGFHIANQLVLGVGFAADGPVAWLLLGAGHSLAALVIALLIPRGRWAQVRDAGPYGARVP